MEKKEVKYFDKESALNAVKKDGSEIRYVSKELRNDNEVVLAAVQNH